MSNEMVWLSSCAASWSARPTLMTSQPLCRVARCPLHSCWVPFEAYHSSSGLWGGFISLFFCCCCLRGERGLWTTDHLWARVNQVVSSWLVNHQTSVKLVGSKDKTALKVFALIAVWLKSSQVFDSSKVAQNKISKMLLLFFATALFHQRFLGMELTKCIHQFWPTFSPSSKWTESEVEFNLEKINELFVPLW